MNTKDLNTEEKILIAAETIFLRDGYDGARMQAIADEASINKALLHYYFRSKDMLFEKIFDSKILKFFPDISEALQSNELSFEQKVHLFIEKYIQILGKYPFLPLFVINTINKPEKQEFIKKLPIHIFQSLIMAYYTDFEKGKIKELNIFQFMISVIGMCAFPFLGKPIIQNGFGVSNEDFDELMNQRINELKVYISLILKP